MPSSVPLNFPAKLLVAFSAFTGGIFLLAFTRQIGLATLLCACSSLATLRNNDLSQPIVPRKRAVWTVIFTAAFLVVMLTSAYSGFTKDSNEWFLNWPYRPHTMLTIWAIVGVIFVALYRKRNDRSAS